MQVPLLDLKAQYATIKDEIKAAIDEVLESQYFILGPKVQKFEEEIAKYCNVQHAVGVASGSDALLLALMAIDIGFDTLRTQPKGYGDEVITTPYTFFATAGSISRLGAKPVFVDIDPKTYNINPELIAEKITDKTKAIIPVHLGNAQIWTRYWTLGRNTTSVSSKMPPKPLEQNTKVGRLVQ